MSSSTWILHLQKLTQYWVLTLLLAAPLRVFITVILICKWEFFSILHSDLIEVINSSCGESIAIKCFKCAVSISEPIQKRLIERWMFGLNLLEAMNENSCALKSNPLPLFCNPSCSTQTQIYTTFFSTTGKIPRLPFYCATFLHFQMINPTTEKSLPVEPCQSKICCSQYKVFVPRNNLHQPWSWSSLFTGMSV